MRGRLVHGFLPKQRRIHILVQRVRPRPNELPSALFRVLEDQASHLSAWGPGAGKSSGQYGAPSRRRARFPLS